jgi:hypothetical protein
MTKQEGSWMMLTGALLIVIGIGLGLYLRAHQVIEYPNMQPQQHKQNGDGDPPVTVSDGSFNAISPYGWVNPGDTILAPPGWTSTVGTLVNKCGLTQSGLVQFFDGAQAWDASPPKGKALQLTITHGSGSQAASVTAVTNSNLTNLAFIDPSSGWQAPSGYSTYYKSENSNSDYISSVTYVDPVTGMTVTKPSIVSSQGKHSAAVSFCYR